MNCRKELVLTGYRVRFVDLREPKPRTPKEKVHVMDQQWLEALRLTHQNVIGSIQEQYEWAGYKVFEVESIPPKRSIVLDLVQLWESAEPSSTAEQAEEDCG